VFVGSVPGSEAGVRVLAVDPGLTRCGYAVVEGGRGGLTPLAYDVIRTGSGEDLPARLLAVAEMLDLQLATFRPQVVAVERVFSQHNVRTVMGTAQASAVAILAAARAGLPVALHTPSEVKAAVTGSGRADKAQVTTMVTKVLRLERAPKPADVADALALAICHLWRAPGQARLAAAVTAVRAGIEPGSAPGAWGGGVVRL
jgi:crossover junction endodeoxyribonuclease RuvC